MESKPNNITALIDLFRMNFSRMMKGGSFQEFSETHPTLFSVIIKSMSDAQSVFKSKSEMINDLNMQQQLKMVHPFTCDRISSQCECNRFPNDQTKDGVLIATLDGWVCPCGEYTQAFALNLANTKNQK
jgi:hypothetical protein